MNVVKISTKFLCDQGGAIFICFLNGHSVHHRQISNNKEVSYSGTQNIPLNTFFKERNKILCKII